MGPLAESMVHLLAHEQTVNAKNGIGQNQRQDAPEYFQNNNTLKWMILSGWTAVYTLVDGTQEITSPLIDPILKRCFNNEIYLIFFIFGITDEDCHQLRMDSSPTQIALPHLANGMHSARIWQKKTK
jgi:hypothetical protein